MHREEIISWNLSYFHPFISKHTYVASGTTNVVSQVGLILYSWESPATALIMCVPDALTMLPGPTHTTNDSKPQGKRNGVFSREAPPLAGGSRRDAVHDIYRNTLILSKHFFVTFPFSHSATIHLGGLLMDSPRSHLSFPHSLCTLIRGTGRRAERWGLRPCPSPGSLSS